MKAILTYIAFAAMAGMTALAQTEQRPVDRPHSVKPIDLQAQTTDTDMIRSKIERMGYTDVVDLSRDSMGIWHARAKKGTESVDVTVDKGGRISLDCSGTRSLDVARIRTVSPPPPAAPSPPRPAGWPSGTS